VTLSFADGSTAGILYTTLGDSSLPKEYGEGFGNGRAETITNFKGGRLNLGQDKGHEGEFEAFVDAILSGEDSLIPLSEIIEVTEATFGINESIRTSGAVPVEIDRYR
jgi:polar amino acid transport system substrate-binding protein